MIGSHYDLIIDWVSTDLIGIPISRNKEAEVVEKIFKMLHTEELTFFEVFETQFPPRDTIIGNVIESLYVLIVACISTDIIGIAISRN